MYVWAGTPCFRGYGRRNGERRRKSVRGCIVSPDLSVLNLVIVKKGENDLPGLTDVEKPRMRGPKRASKIRKLFNLSKEDDVRKYVNTYRRTFTTKAGKVSYRFYVNGNVLFRFVLLLRCGCGEDGIVLCNIDLEVNPITGPTWLMKISCWTLNLLCLTFVSCHL